jgi:glucose-6-phosphate isomerase
MLLALYEHKTYVEAAIWGINPFDQWGVELGKTLAGRIAGELAGDDAPRPHDSSTEQLMGRYRSGRA